MINQKFNYLGLVLLFFSVCSYGMMWEKEPTLEEILRDECNNVISGQRDGRLETLQQEAAEKFKKRTMFLGCYRSFKCDSIEQLNQDKITPDAMKEIFINTVMNNTHTDVDFKSLKDILDSEDERHSLFYDPTHSNNDFANKIYQHIVKNTPDHENCLFKNTTLLLGYYRHAKTIDRDMKPHIMHNIFTDAILSYTSNAEETKVHDPRQRRYVVLFASEVKSILKLEDQMSAYLSDNDKIKNIQNEVTLGLKETTTLLDCYDQAKEIANNMGIDQEKLKIAFCDIVTSLFAENIAKAWVKIFGQKAEEILNQEDAKQQFKNAQSEATQQPDTPLPQQKFWFKKYPLAVFGAGVIAILALLYYLDRLPNNVAQWFAR